MEFDDIKKARVEAKKFIEYVDDFIKASGGDGWDNPAERGLVKAQLIILSRSLSAMRNPWTCKRGKRK